MAPIDPILNTTPVTGIAGPHQSTVATIQRAVELGLFTSPQAELMIDRVRTHLTALPITTSTTGQVASPSTVADSVPATVGGLASDTLLAGLDRTVR
jgi:hypothetical protein